MLYWQCPRFVVETKNPFIELIRKKRVPKQVEIKSNQQKVSIQNDELTLKGILTKSKTDTVKATVILVHGIRSRKEWWQPIGLSLADHSYQTLAIDLRAHGQSQGKYTTFGVKEKNDISAWVNWYKKQPEYQGEPIGIWGQSLGGAVALQTLAIEDEIDFGIIESTYHDFETIANDYSGHYFSGNIQAITDNVLRRAAKLADFKLQEAKPLEASKAIQQPILFTHGSADTRIKLEYNQLNYQSVPHSNKEFYTIEGAGHYNAWKIGGDTYKQKVLEFIDGSINHKATTLLSSGDLSPTINIITDSTLSS